MESDEGNRATGALKMESDESNRAAGAFQMESDEGNRATGALQMESDEGNRATCAPKTKSDGSNRAADAALGKSFSAFFLSSFLSMMKEKRAKENQAPTGGGEVGRVQEGAGVVFSEVGWV